MLAIKTTPKNAEKAQQFIKRKGMADKNYKIEKNQEFIFFPITKKTKTRFEIVKIQGKKRKIQDPKKVLEKSLTKKELEKMKRSFDIVGSIVILEMPKELEKKEKIIAQSFLKRPNIKTVLKKADSHSGDYRTQKMKFLAGERTTKTFYRENNVRLFVDVEKVYFSVRLGEERKRVCRQIKKNESVLVMFSGLAPYPVVFAKNSHAKRIVGIEINPEGHRLGLQNLKLNKIKNTELFCGDVKKVLPNLGEKFDRIVMPLPKTAGEYLDIALKSAKKNATIHFYNFQQAGEFNKAVLLIENECKKLRKTPKVLAIRKVGQQSPRTFRICVDFQVK